MTDVGVGVRPERGRFRQALVDIYHEHTNFNFLGRVWRWALLSGSLLLISVIALAASGLNLGIDFDGGLSWDVRVTGHTPSVGTVRDAVTAAGLKDPKISIRQDRSLPCCPAVAERNLCASCRRCSARRNSFWSSGLIFNLFW